MKLRSFIAVCALIGLVGCGASEAEIVAPQSQSTNPTAFVGGEMVSAKDVQSWKPGEFLIVDVRVATSYEKEVIPGAIPVFFETLGPMYPGVAEHPKSNPIVVVAENDKDALRGAQMLVAGGYDAKGLLGGVREWEQAGLPLEKKSPN